MHQKSEKNALRLKIRKAFLACVQEPSSVYNLKRTLGQAPRNNFYSNFFKPAASPLIYLSGTFSALKRQ